MIEILLLKTFLKNVLVLLLKDFIILFSVASEKSLTDQKIITFGTANGLHIICFDTCCEKRPSP